jgi:hypothetical protein
MGKSIIIIKVSIVKMDHIFYNRQHMNLESLSYLIRCVKEKSLSHCLDDIDTWRIETGRSFIMLYYVESLYICPDIWVQTWLNLHKIPKICKLGKVST